MFIVEGVLFNVLCLVIGLCVGFLIGNSKRNS